MLVKQIKKSKVLPLVEIQKEKIHSTTVHKSQWFMLNLLTWLYEVSPFDLSSIQHDHTSRSTVSLTEACLELFTILPSFTRKRPCNVFRGQFGSILMYQVRTFFHLSIAPTIIWNKPWLWCIWCYICAHSVIIQICIYVNLSVIFVIWYPRPSCWSDVSSILVILVLLLLFFEVLLLCDDLSETFFYDVVTCVIKLHSFSAEELPVIGRAWERREGNRGWNCELRDGRCWWCVHAILDGNHYWSS